MSTAEYTAAPLVADLGAVDVRDEPAADVVVTRAASKTTRTAELRHVDPRSVAKLSAVFYLCACAVLLVAGLVLWIGAVATGVVGNVESFFRDAGFDGFRFAPVQLFRAFALMGLVLVAAGTAANVLLAMLFNLMTELVGGVRVTLSEDVPSEARR